VIARRGAIGSRYHISTPQLVSIRELVEQMCELTGGHFARVVADAAERPGKDAAYHLDSGHLRRTLGWQDEIGLMDGLRDTLAWIDARLGQLRDLPVEYMHHA
jgi:dTDP-glucose 4,6-dehydratase